MSNKGRLQIRNPVSVLNQPLKVSFKDLFKSLTKAVAETATGRWFDAARSAIDAVSAIGLKKDAAQIAWLLIHRSIVQAMYNLVEENLDLIKSSPAGYWNLREQPELSPDDLEALSQKLNLSLEDNEIAIDESFFERPKELSVVADMQLPFYQWLEGMGLNQAQAKAISDRLPTYFVYALNDQWITYRKDYELLIEALDTPFTKATSQENAWSRYAAWLHRQVEEPMFYEAFSLKQVYTPLRAYYVRKIEKDRIAEIEQSLGEDKKPEKFVVSLEKELEKWLSEADPFDAIRVISGGPGCGKSSFAKMFAAQHAKNTERRVLFVPLHRFDPADDLIEAIKVFVEYDNFLPHNPLDRKDGESRLLIVFDGLDELSMQGKVAAEVAQRFVQEVQRKVENFNNQEPRLMVLISGRELAVQANASSFRKPQQILHVLPYFLSEEARKKDKYIDSGKLLEEDLRQRWWAAYGEASGRGYTGMPEQLNRSEIIEITSQPLLNYLVALSLARGKVDFAKAGNLNVIYEDLLKAVYERVWAERQHPSIAGIEEGEFFRILEEIAVSAWHGDARTTTVREIEAHCESSGIKPLLERFKEGAKEGVARLLMAFYFRKSGNRETGDETFEFTHKSFGEYLTAKRIVRGIQRMHVELVRRQENYESGWDDRDALTHWINLCGPVNMNEYLFDFVKNEVSLYPEESEKWQEVLSRLIGFMLRHGTPMERLEPRPSFREESHQARNAEESLLAALNACALSTQKLSKIEWPSRTAAGEWISWLSNKRDEKKELIALKCLSLLDLQDCNLICGNFRGADLRRANLQRVNFVGAILINARLQETNLQDADLTLANVQGAYLQDANLRRACLQDAKLQDTNLQGANLQLANLQLAIWVDGRRIKEGTIDNLVFEDD